MPTKQKPVTRRKAAPKRRRNPDARAISAAKAESIRERSRAYEAARQAFDPKRYKRGGGYDATEMREIARMAGGAKPSNADLSALEVYDFVHSPPDKYFLYIDDQNSRATTWTGDVLGRVVRGGSYKSPSFGQPSVRVPITVHGINGVIYVGTYYASAGNYARVRARKGPRRL